MIRHARKALPGDPHFGDRLSSAGVGGPATAARATHRLLRDPASREMGLATLQIWQAVCERVRRRPEDQDVTLVFTDLVGFSRWALEAGDSTALLLQRRVAQAVEPQFLRGGGHLVKRMGDRLMVCFADPVAAIGAVQDARRALSGIAMAGYTPTMRVGIHTGRPQRIGSDWLGVDVNVAARVMPAATRRHIQISGATLQHLTPEQLERLGVAAAQVRRPLFSPRPTGVPAGVTMYQLREK